LSQAGLVVQPLTWIARLGRSALSLAELISGSFDTKLKVHNEGRPGIARRAKTKRIDGTLDVEIGTRMSTVK